MQYLIWLFHFYTVIVKDLVLKLILHTKLVNPLKNFWKILDLYLNL